MLAYYREALRLEEALSARPLARRAVDEERPLQIDAPTPGQDYAKLTLDGDLAALLEEHRSLRKPMAAELNRFFENWLYTQYRRPPEEDELDHLVCFPVVHFARGELAGLVRFGVKLRFGTQAGAWFRVPSFEERRRGVYPDAPELVHISPIARGQGAWPFFLDTRLLRYPLGLSGEEIDGLFARFRATEHLNEARMLRILAEVLEESAGARGEGDGGSVMGLFGRLTRVVRLLLNRHGRREQVYPVALLIDGSQAKTTFHLQREITSLLEGRAPGDFTRSVPLATYLTGEPQPARSEPMRALFGDVALTESQRAAGELFLGSSFTSVEGPPGTGKTTLILHLCAEAIVRQVEALVDTGMMGARPFVVTSSNNRAVDNVIEALATRGLPLALRAGSRQVCAEVLIPQLRKALSWLEGAERDTPYETRTRELAQAIVRFVAVRHQVEEVLAPYRQARERARERTRLLGELEALRAEEQGGERGGDATLDRLPEDVLLALEAATSALVRRLEALSALCEATPGLAQLNAVARHYGKTAQQELVRFEQALRAAGLTLVLPLPPLTVSTNPAAMMDAWEEGAEQALHELSALSNRVTRRAALRARAEKRAALEARLAALGDERDAPRSTIPDALSRQLFASAVEVREAWARARVSELKDAVSAALDTLERERSLRPLFRHEPEHAKLLCQLFGVWGSTLLSLGNCFPPDAGTLARVVIDEAGQCHPAHAIAALMRADAALIIGDVHQLTPVIELEPDDEARLFRASGLSTYDASFEPYRVHSRAQNSVQSLAERAVQVRPVLVDHFRCQKEIIAVSDALCGYGLVVRTPPQSRTREVAFLRDALSLWDVAGEQERLAGSLYNEAELERVVWLVEQILGCGLAPAELAVITPYRGQLERLRRRFVELTVPMAASAELAEVGAFAPRSEGLALGTVHRFQGGERSIVLFTSVVTRPGSLSFLDERPNLLNVAVSRAQHHFVCIGRREVLEQGVRTRLLTRAARPLVLSHAT